MRNVNYIFNTMFPEYRLGKKVPNFRDRVDILTGYSSCYGWVGITLDTMCPKDFKIDGSQFIEPWSLLAAAAFRIILSLVEYALEKVLHFIYRSINVIAGKSSSQKDDMCDKYCSIASCCCCSLDEEDDAEDSDKGAKKKARKQGQILPFDDSNSEKEEEAEEVKLATPQKNAGTIECQKSLTKEKQEEVNTVFDEIFSDLSDAAKRQLTPEEKLFLMKKCTQDNSNVENKRISNILALDNTDADDGSAKEAKEAKKKAIEVNDRVDFLCFKRVCKSNIFILSPLFLVRYHIK